MPISSASEVVDVFGLPEHPKHDPIPKARIEAWMSSGDIETMGAVVAYLLGRDHLVRIEPPLDLADFQRFLIPYFERCIMEDPTGEWSHSRYAAGWAITNWFLGLWADESVPRDELSRLRAWLARLYKQGDAEMRTSIVNAILEHLLENKEVAVFFSDWRKEPQLREAYDVAIEWSRSAPG